MIMTTKLEALFAVADWMGTYEAGGSGNLQQSVARHDQESLAEYPEDMVAGYRLILSQIAVLERSALIRSVVKITLKRNPTLDRVSITRRVTEVVDAQSANKIPLVA